MLTGVAFITGKYDRNSPWRDYVLAHAHILLRTSFYHVGLHVLYLNAPNRLFVSLKLFSKVDTCNANACLF